MSRVYRHTIYWKGKNSDTYGAYPVEEENTEKAIADFTKTYQNLVTLAIEPWAAWSKAGHPTGEAVLARVKKIPLLDESPPPREYSLPISAARKSVAEHLRPQAEVLDKRQRAWTDAEIDALLGKPTSKPEWHGLPGAPDEPGRGLSTVRPFPNAWGRPT